MGILKLTYFELCHVGNVDWVFTFFIHDIWEISRLIMITFFICLFDSRSFSASIQFAWNNCLFFFFFLRSSIYLCIQPWAIKLKQLQRIYILTSNIFNCHYVLNDITLTTGNGNKYWNTRPSLGIWLGTAIVVLF